ncbi:MAG TPA: threonine synthase [Polyangia bacterium]|nr:threonine synthase [Polyangia bacterium]
MSFVQALQCKECKTQYPKQALHVCERCFGPLEVAYDYAAIGKTLTRETIMSRAPNLWRYRELLPLDAPPTVGLNAGYTPLVRAKRLGDALGLADLWVKNDAVSHPTLSFKDRVVSVALSKAKELGFDTVACASTGNLGNSTAAHAAQAGLRCYVLIPFDLEAGKVLGTQVYSPHLVRINGTYDDVNRLCSEIADRHPWAFVNVNIRPYYAEGSKTYGYEIQEQLGWRTPAHVVVPMASGSLLTKIGRAIDEFTKLGLVDARGTTKLHGAQAAGCGPIAEAVLANREAIKPVKQPNTIAKSLAIGKPADGPYAAHAILTSGGSAAAVSDAEIIEGIQLLAATEGLFTETAGGVTVATAKKLAAAGKIGRDETTVICITGNGLKTQEPLVDAWPLPAPIAAKLDEFEKIL